MLLGENRRVPQVSVFSVHDVGVKTFDVEKPISSTQEVTLFFPECILFLLTD